MGTGYKVAAAGLVVVLGCAVVAFAPNDRVVTQVAADSASAAADGADAGAASGAEGEDAGSTVAISASTSNNAASEPATAAYHDGVYRATASGKLGLVPVTVTVEGGEIASVSVGANSEEPAMLAKAEETVVPQILENQSTEGVEVASGATCSSNAIIEAVASALARAAA